MAAPSVRNGAEFIFGLKETQAALKSLPKAVQRKVLRQATRAGATIIQKTMRANAPVDSGVTRGAIKVRAGKRSRLRVSVMAQIRQVDLDKVAAKKAKSKSKKRNIKRGGKKVKGVFYPAFVEYGTNSKRRGGKLAARRWIAKAYQRSKAAARNVVTSKILDGIERETKQKLPGATWSNRA